MKLLKGLLIDPYKKEIREIQISHDLSAWYKLLQCDYVEVIRLQAVPDGRSTDLWVDEEFLITKGQDHPSFIVTVQNRHKQVVYGYGLVLASQGPESVSIRVGCDNAAEMFGVCFQVGFENWEKRLDQKDVMAELMRLPELEMEGSYKEGWGSVEDDQENERRHKRRMGITE
jgi:hypothetical protein